MSLHKDILNKNKLLLPKRTEESQKWFGQKIKSMSSSDPIKNIGNNIIMFNYYSKDKKSNYPDLFPILFPIGITKDEITGFNLHYVPHIHRAYLMDSLKDRHNKPMPINRNFLKSPVPMKIFSPSLRKYSHKNIRSKVIQILPDEWQQALFLPAQR
jgi:hypothetical protein